MKVKYGVEIHQQLNTKKLHCRCPSTISNDYKDLIYRRLFSRESELGTKDEAAIYEEMKNKLFEYQISDEFCCLIELDEEPPMSLNPEALEIALKIAKAFEAEIVDQICVMRKIIIDGSNVSGFQRTSLIAINGRLVVDGLEIEIPTICLEEDAARIISKDKEKTTYRLDRLGIPLVEISTGVIEDRIDLARAIMEEIGLTLRMVGGVRRGIGTIRQDVNVSIENGARVELKGVPTLNVAEKAIKYEIKRQENLLSLMDELRSREPGPVFTEIVEVTDIVSGSRLSKFLTDGAYAMGISSFSGYFKREILPGLTIGRELADIVKAFSTLKGILHSDEANKYFDDEQISELRKRLEIGQEDGFIILISAKEEALKVFNILRERIKRLWESVPNEVRRVLDDGTSRFLRPLPGSHRMYPETDIPPLLTKDIKVPFVEPIWKKREKYSSMGLSRDEVNILLRKGLWEKFEDLAKEHNPKKIARLLCYDIEKIENKLNHNFDEKELSEFIEFYSKHELPERFLIEILRKWLETKEPLEELLLKEKVPRETLEKFVIENKENINKIIPLAIKNFNCKIDLNELREIINNLKNKG